MTKRFYKHIAMDLNLAGSSDPKVFALAQKENRLLITYNTRDFIKLIAKGAKTK